MFKKKSSTSKAGAKMAGNVSQVPMPAGTPQAPGPINDPRDHPVDNLPAPTDPRWGDLASSMATPGGEGGM